MPKACCLPTWGLLPALARSPLCPEPRWERSPGCSLVPPRASTLISTPCPFAAIVPRVGRTNPQFPLVQSSSHDQTQLEGLKIASPGCQRCQVPGRGKNPAPRWGHQLQRRGTAVTHSGDSWAGPRGLPETGRARVPGAEAPEEPGRCGVQEVLQRGLFSPLVLSFSSPPLPASLLSCPLYNEKKDGAVEGSTQVPRSRAV